MQIWRLIERVLDKKWGSSNYSTANPPLGWVALVQ
jgi:hypothetical protein